VLDTRAQVTLRFALHPQAPKPQGKSEVALTVMPTLGEEIKHRREARNISLNDVSESTRISIRFLKAIEADNFAVLPGGIFTRSFIRAYAKEVGMPEEEAMTLYNRHVVAQQAAEQQAAEQEALSKGQKGQKKSSSNNVSILQAEAPPVVAKPPKTKSSKPMVAVPQTNWSTILIGVGILVLLGILVTVLVRQLNKAQASKNEQARNAAMQKASEPEPTNNAATSPAPDSAPTNPETTTPSPTTTTQPSVPSGDELQVKLEASTGDCWVRFQADDAPAEQTIIKQGQTQAVPPAKSAVKVTYGNRQSLKVIINNREATLPETLPKFKGQIIISRDTLATFFQPQTATPQ